jgi:hypothetical protein
VFAEKGSLRWSSPGAPLAAAMAARCGGKARGGEVSSFIGAHAWWRGSRESSPSGLRHGARPVRAATTYSQPGAVLRAYGGDAVGWPARRA